MGVKDTPLENFSNGFPGPKPNHPPLNWKIRDDAIHLHDFSLKLTWPLEIDAWKMIHLLLGLGLFSGGERTVSFRQYSFPWAFLGGHGVGSLDASHAIPRFKLPEDHFLQSSTGVEKR